MTRDAPSLRCVTPPSPKFQLWRVAASIAGRPASTAIPPLPQILSLRQVATETLGNPEP